jgi:hypothetical protein
MLGERKRPGSNAGLDLAALLYSLSTAPRTGGPARAAGRPYEFYVPSGARARPAKLPAIASVRVDGLLTAGVTMDGSLPLVSGHIKYVGILAVRPDGDITLAMLLIE